MADRPPERPRGTSWFTWRSLLRPFRAKEEGTMPAGIVLIVVVAALLVAMVLNADATLRKSNSKGDGWRNEVAKTIASVSDTLHITDLRGGVDDALGKNQGTDTDVEQLLAEKEAEGRRRPERPAAGGTAGSGAARDRAAHARGPPPLLGRR